MSEYETAAGVTKRLSRYIAELKYEDIPPLVIDRVKMLALHTIGVSLSALELQQAKDTLALAKEFSGGSQAGEATLIGDGAKLSLEAAEFAAGVLADTLDWEDCAWAGHPSSGVIPGAVFAAQAYHKSGKELLTAIVAGYEVYHRIGMAAKSNINGLNLFAALVPIVKLMDLDEEQINRALSMAAVCAAVPVEMHSTTMSDVLNYLYGYKTLGAVSIARLAQQGLDGPTDALDDPQVYAAHMRTNLPKWYLKDLGEEYFLMNVLVKHWPANFYVQTYVELAEKLREKYDIDPDAIERIIIHRSIAYRHYTSETGFESLTQAEFSTPYCVAVSFYHPQPGSNWYFLETMKDPRVVALMNKVEADGYIQQLPSMWKAVIQGNNPKKGMTVVLKDGRSYTEYLYTHKGHPSYMFTEEEFQDNFRNEAKNALTAAEIERVLSLFDALEELPDAAVLAESLFSKTESI